MAKSQTRRQIEQRTWLLVVRWASLTAGLLPLPMLRAVADGAAYLIMLVSPQRQRLAEANIAASFPELSPAECRGIRRRSVRNIARTLLEMFKLRSLSREQLDRLVVAEGGDPLLQALREGSGVLFVSAHFGNWELMGAYASEFLAPLTVVARDEVNGLSERVLNEARRSHGMSVVGRNDAREMLRVLESGGLLAMLPDQHAAAGGRVLLPFLGRPAWTATGPAQLVRRTGARVFPAFCVRSFKGPYRIEIHPEVEVVCTDDPEADVLENTRRISAAIERVIRSYPDNWLWLHNRWKRADEAPAAPAEAAGLTAHPG